MKKQLWLAMLVIAGLPLLANAEPIAFEQGGNVTGLTGIEVGLDFDYSYEKIEAGGNSLMGEIVNTLTDIPIFVRIGLPVMEIKVTIPYGSVSSNMQATQEEDWSGIKNIGVGVKTGLLGLPVFNLGVGINTRFPTAEPKSIFLEKDYL